MNYLSEVEVTKCTSYTDGNFFHGILQFRVAEVDSASKNEYQYTSGGKDGRCVWLTTYHLQVLDVVVLTYIKTTIRVNRAKI
jgi:hypothetical protein